MTIVAMIAFLFLKAFAFMKVRDNSGVFINTDIRKKHHSTDQQPLELGGGGIFT